MLVLIIPRFWAKGDIMRLGGETRGYGVIFQQGRIFLCRRSLTSGLSLTLTLLVLDDSFLARLDFQLRCSLKQFPEFSKIWVGITSKY